MLLASKTKTAKQIIAKTRFIFLYRQLQKSDGKASNFEELEGGLSQESSVCIGIIFFHMKLVLKRMLRSSGVNILE